MPTMKDKFFIDDNANLDFYTSPRPTTDKPVYRVQPKVTRRKGESDGVMTMEEKGLMLESIWSHDDNYKKNVSDGQCSNAQIGIVYTYDLSDEWLVHITCDQENIFYRLETQSNLPIFRDAQGALGDHPPIEHVTSEYTMDDFAEEKSVSPRLFDVSYFQGYCQGKVVSVARKSELDILTLEEEQERRRGYLERKKEWDDMAEDRSRRM